MNIRFSAVAVAVAAAFPFVSNVFAATEKQGDAVIVSATRIEMADVAATYASEVHSRKDIERSGATTLVDYLAQQTSLQVLPNFGNRFSPSINMRGYGAGNGFQNVVISLDGRRLNNIDLAPQLLGAIPLVNIDRIEIAKGSGSVMYGDGATAGTIQIYTRARDGASIEAYAGNFGALGSTLNAGLVRDSFSVSATVDHSEHDGYSDKDPSGHRDESTADIWNVALTGKPVGGLKLNLDVGGSRIDTRYPGSLTLARFLADPGQNKGTNYTHQKFESDYWTLGGAYRLNSNWELSAQHSHEDKLSKFLPSNFKGDYRYVTDDIALQYLGDALSVTAGVQAFDGVREGSSDQTTKSNLAAFVQGQYDFERLTLSAGARGERVEYEFDPVTGTRLKDDEKLQSWDLGANFRISDALSVFGNYNKASQAPDIDRFFATDFSVFPAVTNFNGFIRPVDVRTLTLGLNHVAPANRIKVSVFHSDLKNEIYFFRTGPFSGLNTNIDKSHKYGLELQDVWHITPMLTGTLNYTWTRAIIDRENLGAGTFDGKELPGVPKHGLIVGLNVGVGSNGSLNLTHSWRSKAWAADDFDNNNAQKQREYQSTDLAYRYRLKSLELYAAVANLFEYENGVWVRDNAIYPINFERTWRLGAKLSF